MTKKTFFSLVALAGNAIAVGAVAAKPVSVKADEATGWTCVNGARAITKDGDKVTMVTDAWSVEHQKDEKVYLDGLTFTFGQENPTSGSPVGFFFTEQPRAAWDNYSGATILLGSNWGQMRMLCCEDHNANSSVSHWYASMDATSPGCGGQASPQIVGNDGDLAYKYSFARENAVWWSISITEVVGSKIWGDTANYVKDTDTGLATVKLYIKDEDMALGEDGSGYMQVFGLSGSATVSGFANGTAWAPAEGPDKDTAKNYLSGVYNGLNSFEYGSTNWTSITDLYTTAVAAVDEATTQDAIDAILAQFKIDLEGVTTRTWAATDEWACTFGAYEARVPQASEGVVKLNTDAFGVTYTKAEKVTLDGFSMDFGSYGCPNGTPVGFWFSQDPVPTKDGNTGYSGAVPSIWKAKWSGQDRLGVYASHDPASDCKVYQDMSGDAQNIGFGGAGEKELVFSDAYNPTFINFAFEHVKKSWWKMTITETDYSSISFAAANQTTLESGKKQATVYIKAADLGVDEEGKAYLNVYGLGGYAVIKNVVNGTYRELPEEPATTEEIANFKAKINAACADYREGFATTADTLKTAALDAIDAKTLASEMEPIVEKLQADVKAAYLEYLAYEDLEANDPTSNFYSPWGQPVFGKRLNDEGAVMMSLTNGYGTRGEFVRTYDPLNFKMVLNVSALKSDTALQINFDTVAGSYGSEATKYYTIEFLMRVGKAHAIVGNTNAHNISVEQWGSVNDNTYTGQPITFNNSGDITIEVTTNVDTNKTTISINGVSAEIDTPVLNKGADASNTPSAAHIQVGTMNGSGLANVRFDVIEDAASKAYAEGLSAAVETALATVSSTKTTVIGLYASETAGDAEYAAYKEAYDAAVATFGQFPLTSYDYNYYVKSAVDAALADMAAPQTDYAAKVAAAKAEVTAFLDTYSADAYREDEQEALSEAKTTIAGQLEEAASLAAVAEVRAAAKETLDAIKTNAQYEAEEALAAAKATASATLNAKLDEASDDNITAVAKLIGDGKSAITACTTIADVETTLASFIDQIDAVLNTGTETSVSEGETSVSEQPVVSEVSEVTSEVISTPDTSTTTSEEPENPTIGCGGSIAVAGMLVSMLSLAGIALVAKRKED